MQGRAVRTASKARAAWPEHVGRDFPAGRRCFCIPQGSCLALCPHQPPQRALLLPPDCYKDLGALGYSCPPGSDPSLQHGTATPGTWWLRPQFAARRGDTRSWVWGRGCHHPAPPAHRWIWGGGHRISPWHLQLQVWVRLHPLSCMAAVCSPRPAPRPIPPRPQSWRVANPGHESLKPQNQAIKRGSLAGSREEKGRCIPADYVLLLRVSRTFSGEDQVCRDVGLGMQPRAGCSWSLAGGQRRGRQLHLHSLPLISG